MPDNLTCIYRNKAGKEIKTISCSSDETIGTLGHFSFKTDELYCLAEIFNPYFPESKISIIADGKSLHKGNTVHSGVDVIIELKMHILENSNTNNTSTSYNTYLTENNSLFSSILLVGGLCGFDVAHVENELTCTFYYEMYELPYYYSVDLESIFDLTNQIKQLLLNFEKN